MHIFPQSMLLAFYNSSRYSNFCCREEWFASAVYAGKALFVGDNDASYLAIISS
jgi:hypothetical protein